MEHVVISYIFILGKGSCLIKCLNFIYPLNVSFVKQGGEV